MFSIEPYESETLFALPFCKYCSNVCTVSENKFSVGLKQIVGGIIF